MTEFSPIFVMALFTLSASALLGVWELARVRKAESQQESSAFARQED